MNKFIILYSTYTIWGDKFFCNQVKGYKKNKWTRKVITQAKKLNNPCRNKNETKAWKSNCWDTAQV